MLIIEGVVVDKILRHSSNMYQSRVLLRLHREDGIVDMLLTGANSLDVGIGDKVKASYSQDPAAGTFLGLMILNVIEYLEIIPKELIEAAVPPVQGPTILEW